MLQLLISSFVQSFLSYFCSLSYKMSPLAGALKVFDNVLKEGHGWALVRGFCSALRRS